MKITLITILIFCIAFSLPEKSKAEIIIENQSSVSNNIETSVTTGNNDGERKQDGQSRIKTEIDSIINGKKINETKVDKYFTGNGKVEINNRIEVKKEKIESSNEIKINNKQEVNKKTETINQSKNSSLETKIKDEKKIIQKEKKDVPKAEERKKINLFADLKKDAGKKIIPFWKKITLSFNNFFNFINQKIKIII